MEVPKFLLKKRYLAWSVVFVAVFSVIFMTVYQPFSSTTWFDFSSARHAALTLSFYAIAICFMALSKAMFYRLLCRRTEVTMQTYVLWIASEYVIIALIYYFFTKYFLGSGDPLSAVLILRIALCVFLIVAIPYTIFTLWTAYKARTEEYHLLLLASRTDRRETSGMLRLFDYAGSLKITVSAESVYYVESMDNYVQIHYELDGKMMTYMLRVSTKKLEEMFAGTSLVRCHRSYIVNAAHVKCVQSFKDKAVIVMDKAGLREIPVSKSYLQTVMSRITSNT